MKSLFLLRGLPGAGKSTLAKSIGVTEHYEADMFFVNDKGDYQFDPTKLKNAHQWCNDLTWMAMTRCEPKIAVSNTFTQEWEMDAYYKLAEEYGYTVFSLIVENRHGGKNVHSCSAEKVEIMRNRFEIQL